MKKGFILVETIIVILVLSVILVALYASYSNLLIKVNKKDLYNNTEYIYKTLIVRDYLKDNLSSATYENSIYYMYCNNLDESKKCYDGSSKAYQNKLFSILKVEAVYIFNDLLDIDVTALNEIEPTTLNYIKSLDLNENGTRILVMFKDENDESDKDIFQYANLSFEGLV